MEERIVRMTQRPVYFEERRKYPRYSITLPFEYWHTDDACYGGLVGNVSQTGLLIYSVLDMPVREELNVRIFFSNGYRFDGIRALARIVWKDRHRETDWKGYKCGLEFIQISAEDRQKLADLLRCPSTSEEVSLRGEVVPRDPPSEIPVSSPSPNLDLCQIKGSDRTCLWGRLKTKLFHLR
jgi:PilZ domain